MENKKRAKIFEGTVVSNKMQKTIVVKVERFKLNKKYKKKYRVSRKFKVHDEKGEYKIGDIVYFISCRPISKEKKWRAVGLKKRIEEVKE